MGEGVAATLAATSLVLLGPSAVLPGLPPIVAPLVWLGPGAALLGPWLSRPKFVGRAGRCDQVSLRLLIGARCTVPGWGTGEWSSASSSTDLDVVVMDHRLDASLNCAMSLLCISSKK